MTDSEGQKQQQNGAGEWKTHAALENSNFILTASLSVLCAAIAEAASKYPCIFSKGGYAMVNLVIPTLITLVTVFRCQMTPLVWPLLPSRQQAGKWL